MVIVILISSHQLVSGRLLRILAGYYLLVIELLYPSFFGAFRKQDQENKTDLHTDMVEMGPQEVDLPSFLWWTTVEGQGIRKTHRHLISISCARWCRPCTRYLLRSANVLYSRWTFLSFSYDNWTGLLTVDRCAAVCFVTLSYQKLMFFFFLQSIMLQNEIF